MKKLLDEHYFAINAESASGIKEFIKSPAHYRQWQTGEREVTPAMKLGTAVHTCVLEPDMFAKHYTWTDLDKRTKEFKEFCRKNRGGRGIYGSASIIYSIRRPQRICFEPCGL